MITLGQSPSAPLFPPEPSADRALLAVVAILAAMACAAAMLAKFVWTQAEAWTAHLDSKITVEVASEAGLTGLETAQEAAFLLSQQPGVVEATALNAEDYSELLGPWFGVETLPDTLPLPGMVDVAFDPRTPPDPAQLAAALNNAGFTVTVDDHGIWRERIEQLTDTARWSSLTAMVLLIAACALVTVFAARASLRARRDVVEVLHLAGAHDAFIASEVTRRFLVLGGKAGGLGAGLAACAGLLWWLTTRASDQTRELLEGFRLTPWDGVILVATPVLTAAIAATAARHAALATLRETPS